MVTVGCLLHSMGARQNLNSADLAEKKIKLELAFQNALRIGNQHVESIFTKKNVDKINKHQSQIVANCWLLTVF